MKYSLTVRLGVLHVPRFHFLPHHVSSLSQASIPFPPRFYLRQRLIASSYNGASYVCLSGFGKQFGS